MAIRLAKVFYELFESDLEGLGEGRDPHTIDREIRLEFEDGATFYISWCTQPIQYCIGIFRESQFNPEPKVTVDMSNSSIWAPLIGRELEMDFEDDDHQALMLLTGGGGVRIQSTSETGFPLMDCVTVSAVT